ncbi:MAG: hypothetical protein R6V62_11370 [Candidatus Fermentibacteraceae bacterium]
MAENMSERMTVLACGTCHAPLFGLSTDSSFLCQGCGTAWGIGRDGLSRLQSSVRVSRSDDALPLPFWLVEAGVTVESRTTRREIHQVGVERGRWFSPATESGLRETGGYSGERKLVIPAFSVNGLFDIAVRLSAAVPSLPPEVDAGWPRLAGVFSSPDEVPELTRGVCTGQEASAPDWLADVRLSVSVRFTSLMVLPALLREETVFLPGPGVSFYRRNMPDLERVIAFHSEPHR